MERKRLLLLIFILPIIASVMMGLILSPFFDNFWMGWLNGIKFFYFIGAAPLHVGLLVAIILKIDAGFSAGCGAGLYYGTWLGGALIRDTFRAGYFSYIAAFVISALVSYIVWLKAKQ